MKHLQSLEKNEVNVNQEISFYSYFIRKIATLNLPLYSRFPDRLNTILHEGLVHSGG
jgi:hypothetical protein